MAKKKAQGKKQARAPSSLAADVCFVIMPFGGWLDDYYDSIYRPAIEACDLEPHRADDLYRPSTIVHDIWAYTKRAKLLVADLSGKNPNVFYELGLAHALAKPAILVAESIDDIPFDLRALRVIVYDKNAPEWGAILRDKVQSSIKEVLKAPVEAVLPAFLNLKDSTAKPTITPHERELIEIKQDLDLLRREMRSRASDSHERRIDIGAEEARSRIEDYVRRGMPDSMIVRRLERLGPPPEWIRSEIRLLKRNSHQVRNHSPAHTEIGTSAASRRKKPVTGD